MLRRVRPAILHASLFHANLCGRLLGRLSGVPIVITWRHSVEIGGQWRERINRWTARLDDRAVAVCELVRQAEIVRGGAPAGRVVTVYNGVDVDRFSAKEPQVVERVRRALGIPVDALLLGTVGRHSPEKDLANLLAAMVAVRDHVPTAWLVLVGGGELRGQLETQVRSLGLSDAVVFAGVRDDVPEILAALDLFVLPSRWEGLPLAVLEAMAARLPVVATAVGGVPEVVVDGLTGLLVPPGDPPALAGALLSLARDAGRRRAMGQAGYERVREHFAMAQMARAMERLYEELLAEKRG
jgi:glycosyltransferase involved in cell wall biosynthesis